MTDDPGADPAPMLAADSGLLEAGDEPAVRLLQWRGPWPEDDPDGNFKTDVAIYADADPMVTLRGLAEGIDVPVGALARYVLAKWASGGSEGLLELGPSTVARMKAVVDAAEVEGTDEARLAAYDVLRQQVSWLVTGMDAAAD